MTRRLNESSVYSVPAFISYCSPVQSRKTCVSASIYEFDSVAIGQHVYKRVWTPLTDESVSASMREDNERHEYAVND